jgi:hypothetical protein
MRPSHHRHRFPGLRALRSFKTLISLNRHSLCHSAALHLDEDLIGTVSRPPSATPAPSPPRHTSDRYSDKSPQKQRLPPLALPLHEAKNPQTLPHQCFAPLPQTGHSISSPINPAPNLSDLIALLTKSLIADADAHEPKLPLKARQSKQLTRPDLDSRLRKPVMDDHDERWTIKPGVLRPPDGFASDLKRNRKNNLSRLGSRSRSNFISQHEDLLRKYVLQQVRAKPYPAFSTQ